MKIRGRLIHGFDLYTGKYGILSNCSRDHSFAMELLEENASMLTALSLYIHCLAFDSQSFIKSCNLACCRFSTVLGHVSFPKELRERRLCLFVWMERLKDLKNKNFPAVIKVKSSCIHKVSKVQFAIMQKVFIPISFSRIYFTIWCENVWEYRSLDRSPFFAISHIWSFFTQRKTRCSYSSYKLMFYFHFSWKTMKTKIKAAMF